MNIDEILVLLKFSPVSELWKSFKSASKISAFPNKKYMLLSGPVIHCIVMICVFE